MESHVELVANCNEPESEPESEAECEAGCEAESGASFTLVSIFVKVYFHAGFDRQGGVRTNFNCIPLILYGIC